MATSNPPTDQNEHEETTIAGPKTTKERIAHLAEIGREANRAGDMPTVRRTFERIHDLATEEN